MNARYIQAGDTINFIPTSDIAAGDIVVFGKLIGVAARSITANALGTIDLSGVFEVVKDTSVVVFGAEVYWTGSTATTAVDNGKTGDEKITYSKIGISVSAADADTKTVFVRLG